MRLPAEWHPQQLVLFVFPQRNGGWGDLLDAASSAILAAARRVQQVTPVLMIVGDADHFALYADRFTGETLELPTDDLWVRDYGPLTVFDTDGKAVLLDPAFNGWGARYEHADADRFCERLHAARFPDVEYLRADFILEGGAVDSDGQGGLLTTTSCLFAPNRNGWDDPEKADLILRNYFGKKTDVFWLTNGELLGDDTDGHVDMLARFLDERTIVYVRCTDKKDPHYPALKEMWEDLRFVTTPHAKPYKLLPLPLPPPLRSAAGKRLPASYVNFLISNGTVFVPTYFSGEADDHPGKASDAAALAVFEQHGKYKVVAVDCRVLIEQGGAVHCATMQVPRW